MANNLLVDWLNNKKNNVQTNVLKKAATNTNNVTIPNLPIKPTTVSQTGLNLQKAQQPVQTRLNNLNTQTLPTQTNTGVGSVSQNPNQSRFIGFQQQPQAKSFSKLINNEYLYVPTAASKAEEYNKEEEKRYRTDEQIIKDFAWDVKNSNGNLTKKDISKYYKEWEGNENAALQLQVDILPLVQQGQFPDMNWVSQAYGELLKGKNLKDIEQVKRESENFNKKFQFLDERIDKVLKSNWDTLSSNGMKYVQNAKLLRDVMDEVRKRGVVGGANDYEVLQSLIKNNPKLQNAIRELNSLELTDGDRAKLGFKDTDIKKKFGAEILNLVRDEFDLYDENEASDEEIETGIRAREKLESDFGNQTWMKIATEINVPLDSLEKFAYKTYKDIQNKFFEGGAKYTKNAILKTVKSAFKDGLGIELTDDQADAIKNLYDKGVMPSIQGKIATNQQEVLAYQDIVNKEYESRKRRNLDEDIENFYNNRSMTSMLLNGDLKGFGYKAIGETAQNADMLFITGLGIVAPEIVLPLMAADSYARESQESFEELSNIPGVTYEQAQNLSAVVGVASATVELALEKLIGGVETTASKAFHDMLMKDFTKKATEMVAEKGLLELLKQGAITQFRSSLEEGLEEVVQQAIHNKAIQKYDPDQKLTEGMLEAFEGGFFNLMNLMAGGGDVLNNFNANKDSIGRDIGTNLGTTARNIVDWFGGGTPPPAGPNGPTETRQNVIQAIKNKITSQGGTNNTQQQGQQTQLSTASENQNNINGDNNTENGGWSQPKKGVIGKALSGIGKAYDSTVGKAIDTVAEKGAEAITSTSTPQDKLFQAVSPTLNKLTNKRGNYKQKRQNADRTNELIVEYGHTPTNSTEYYDALIKTKNALWKNEIQRGLDEHKYTTISSKELTDAVRDEMQEDARFPLETNKSDLAKLNKELASLDVQGELTLEQLEAIKQQINAKLNYGKNAEAGEIYEKGLRAMNTKISQIEDQLIAKLPGEFTKFKKDYGALKDMEEDVLKMMLKDMKKKDGGGLTQNMGRLAGVGKLLSSPLEGTMQIIFGETIGKAKETNFLIQKGFEDLRNQYKGEKKTLDVKDKPAEKVLALPDGIKLTKVTEIDARKPKNKVTKKNNKSDNNKKSDSSSSDDGGTPTGGTPTGTNPTNNQGGTPAADDTKNKVIKKKAETKTKTTSKKSAVTEYINETPQNERGQMEEIEAEETLRSNETPQRDMVGETPKNKVTGKKTEATAPKQEEKQPTKIVDKNGNPKTVYHYSDTDFKEFDLSKQKNKLGIYFSPTSKPNSKLRKYRINATINMQNPLAISPNNKASQIYPELQQYISDEQEIEYDTKFRELLIKGGYDGVIMEDEKGNVTQYVVLNPDQVNVKSQGPIKQNAENSTVLESESKTMATTNSKNNVTNPSKAKTTSLFNENEVDKGNKPEGLNSDALPLSDYREMQRLTAGGWSSLASAISRGSLKDYMANKIANEKVGNKPDWDDNEAWDKLPEDFEDDWGAVASDIEDMYDAYEEYLDMKNGGDTFDENTLKNTLESANDYANRQFPGKTAKEVIDQYTPQYEADLKIYNRLFEKYPGLANRKIDLTGSEGKSRREFADQENETTQDIDYQELAERENETPQVEDEELNTSPLDLEFEAERRTTEELDENETPGTNEEEMNSIKRHHNNADYENYRIKDSANYKFEDIKDLDIDDLLSKDGFEKYTFEEDGQKKEGYAGYINGKAVDIIPNKEKNRITINVGDELFRSFDDDSINVQLVDSDEILQFATPYDNEVFKGILAKALKTNYKALGEPKSYKYDKDNGIFEIYDKSASDKIIYELNLGDKVLLDDGTIYDTSKHSVSTQREGVKYFDREAVKDIFEGKTLIGISRDIKYTNSEAQGTVINDMDSIQELEWLLEDKNNILVGEINGTPIKLSALNSNYNPVKIEDVSINVDPTNKIKTYELQVGNNADNTYFYDTFSELKSALKKINSGENVNKTTTEVTGEKNAVTAKQTENEKPKNLVTSRIEDNFMEEQSKEQQSEFETLPDNVTVSQEAKQLGAKRIAPDRVPRQQLIFDEGSKKIQEQVKTVADYIQLKKDYYDDMYGQYEGDKDSAEIMVDYSKAKKDIQQILWEDWQFKSNKSKEFIDLRNNIKDNIGNEKGLNEVGKNFYISKVKKDISKGYVYPQEVLDKIPGAKKAMDNRERYEKGLNTSFSAKDERIDYSEKDKIGAGMKSQDGKQITKEQKEDIVKGILDFGKTLGLDMKKFAEDRGLVYVHLHGGLAFLNNMAAGLYRESTNEQGEKNISVSVGGAENVRYKDPKTKERKTTTLNTTMSHELGHAMDYLLDNKLFSWTQKSILGSKYNPVNRLRKYYAKGNEIVARAIEQYVAVENGQPNYYLENGNLDAGEFKGTDLEYALKEVGSYYERPGYWSKPDYEKYVKPYVEEAFKNNFEEYKINKGQKNVLGNDKNKVTTQAARAYSPTIVMRFDENGNPVKKNDKNLISNKKNKVTTNAEAIRNPIIKKEIKDTNTENSKENNMAREQEIVRKKKEKLNNDLIQKANDIKKLGKKLGYKLSNKKYTDPVKIALQALTDTNWQQPKGTNKLTADEQDLYDKKGDLVIKVEKAIKSKVIKGYVRWGIDMSKVKKNSNNGTPGVKIYYDGVKWEYHFPRQTKTAQKVNKRIKLNPF